MTLSFENLQQTLQRLGVPLPVSEVYGLGCGLLCVLPSAAAKTRWFTEVLDAASLTADAVSARAGEIKMLDGWFIQTLEALNDAEFNFSPELLEDTASIDERLCALRDFCGGFTYGAGIALSQRGQQSIPEDSREIISDFQAIESVDPDAVPEFDPENPQSAITESYSSDDKEAMYIELLEYVRVGVLLVMEELRPVSPITPQGKPS